MRASYINNDFFSVTISYPYTFKTTVYLKVKYHWESSMLPSNPIPQGLCIFYSFQRVPCITPLFPHYTAYFPQEAPHPTYLSGHATASLSVSPRSTRHRQITFCIGSLVSAAPSQGSSLRTEASVGLFSALTSAQRTVQGHGRPSTIMYWVVKEEIETRLDSHDDDSLCHLRGTHPFPSFC